MRSIRCTILVFIISAAITGNTIIAQVPFSELKIIDQFEPGLNALQACDFDGDGDIDLLISNGSLYLYENTDGKGTFQRQELISSGISKFYLADMDKDQDLDVLAFDGNSISWYENLNGEGTFGEVKIIVSGLDRCVSIEAVDLDGDTDPDVMYTGMISDENRLAWFENTDGFGRTFSNENIIEFAPDYVGYAKTANLNGDDYPDILTIFQEGLVWYENNNGNGSFASRQDIYSSGVTAFNVGDLDNDNDIDVFLYEGITERMLWFENVNPQERFNNTNQIPYYYPQAPISHCYAEDIDSDHDFDIVFAIGGYNRIGLIINNDDGETFSEELINESRDETVKEIAVSDFDNDGDIDIVFAGEKLGIYENLLNTYIPEAPLLNSPTNNSDINTNTPIINWSVPQDLDEQALDFKIEIATDGEFIYPIPESPIESKINLAGFAPTPPRPQSIDTCHYKFQNPLPDGTYYWRVSAWDGFIYGSTSNTFSFRIDSEAPGIPVNLFANGANPSPWQQNNQFTITWENPPDSSQIVRAYYKLGSSPIINFDTTATVRANFSSEPEIHVAATQENGQMLHLWLEDSLGNSSFQNHASVELRYYTDREAPDSPITLLANGNNPSPLQKGNNRFRITWENPPDSSAIMRYFYKLGPEPDSNDDYTGFLNAIPGMAPQLTIEATQQWSQMLYIWLQDSVGNVNYRNRASIELRYYYDTQPPNAPLNLKANGSNPSPWQKGGNQFKVTWQNPPDSSALFMYFYKLGAPPLSQGDAFDSGLLNSGEKQEILVEAQRELGDTLYVWLMDSLENVNPQNHSAVILNYYTKLPDVKILEPKPGDNVSSMVNINAKISPNLPHHQLFYRTESQFLWQSIGSDMLQPINDSLYYFNWTNSNDTGNVRIKLAAWESVNHIQSDSVKIQLNTLPYPIAHISLPVDNSCLNGEIKISGFAAGPYFNSYSLRLQQGETDILQINEKTARVDTALTQSLFSQYLEEGEYRLCLTVSNDKKLDKNHIITFTVDNTPPVAVIESPASGELSCGVPIQYMVADSNINRFSVKYAPIEEDDPEKYIPLDVRRQPCGTFRIYWNTMNLNGTYRLILTAEDLANLPGSDEKIYTLNNPVFEANKEYSKKQEEVGIYIPANGYHSCVICLEKREMAGFVFNTDSVNFVPTGLIYEILSTSPEKKFLKSTILTFDYANYKSELDETRLRIFHYNANHWEIIGGSVNKDSTLLRARIPEIGTYGVFENIDAKAQILKEYELHCVPRVFSPSGGASNGRMSISLTLSQNKNATIKIYNTAGRLIRLLQENKAMHSGENLEEWDGRDHSGHICPTGLYIVAIKLEDKLVTKTVVVMNK